VGRRVGRGDEGLDGDGEQQGQRRGDVGLGAVEGGAAWRTALARRRRRLRRGALAWGAGASGWEERAAWGGGSAEGRRDGNTA
jgi:hypothetical protein